MYIRIMHTTKVGLLADTDYQCYQDYSGAPGTLRFIRPICHGTRECGKCDAVQKYPDVLLYILADD